MPKRIPTPPPGDDEPRYLTVVHPYPLHANMEAETDRVAFVYWMASCIGREHLYAFFHKPKSPNMVIIEVNRDFPNFDAVLGEHRWAEVLREPSDEEKVKVSRVFYCSYSTGREVEKYGWKRVFIRDSWYETADKKQKWRQINSMIAHPYPQTYRCEIPVEDKTRERLCRPLPTKSFPPLPPTRTPTVGTPEWMKAKEAEAAAPKAKAPANAWAKEASQSTANAKTAGKAPQAPGISLGVRNMSGWARGPQTPSLGPLAPPGLTLPPGLLAPTVSPNTSSSLGSSSPDSGTLAPPGLELKRNSSSPLSNTSSEGEGGGDNTTWWPGGDVPQSDNIAISGEASPPALETPAFPSVDDIYADDDDWVPPVAAALIEPRHVVHHEDEAEPPVEQSNLWAEIETQPDLEPEFLCPTHGEMCKPQMCKDHGKYAAEKQREERRRERENKDTTGDWRSRKGKGRARGRLSERSDYSTNSEDTVRSDTSRSYGPVTGSNRIPIPARPARLNSRQSTASPADRSTPSPSTGSSTVPAKPARLNNRQASGSPEDESGARLSPGARSVPARPARLNVKRNGSSPDDDPSRTPSPGNRAVPPKPARLNSNRSGQGSAFGAAASPAAAKIPAKPARLNGRNGNGASTITATPARSGGTIPAKPARLNTKAGAAPGGPKKEPVENKTTSAKPSADPWDLNYRPMMFNKDDDAHSVAPSSVGGWGNVSEGPWGDGNGGNRKQGAKEEAHPKRSWADEMDDEETRSVAETVTSHDGWSSASVGPW